MRNFRLVSAGLAAAGLYAGALGASAASAAPAVAPAQPHTAAAVRSSSHGTTLKTRTIHGTKVLTNASGRTLYWFVPDTSSMSKCSGSCAQFWPPVAGPAHASGVSGKFGTITRSGGAKQATYRGHPLYTYIADTKPGQAKGNNVNLNGGVWHEMTASGSTSGGGKSSSGGGGGGGGGGY